MNETPTPAAAPPETEVPQGPQPAPLRVMPNPRTPKLRAAKTPKERLRDDGAAEYRSVWREIWRNHQGSATPFEDLIVDLVTMYIVGKRLPEPDLVEADFSSYRREYEDAVALARQLVAERPELFSSPKPIRAA